MRRTGALERCWRYIYIYIHTYIYAYIYIYIYIYGGPVLWNAAGGSAR